VSTTIPLALKNTINSRTAFVGQAIYCETIYPIALGNRIVIPVGTYVKGSVTQVVRPGRVKGKSQVGIRFDTITLPNGTTRRCEPRFLLMQARGMNPLMPRKGRSKAREPKARMPQRSPPPQRREPSSAGSPRGAAKARASVH
jgi:type IV secretion system protein VirB10